MMTRKGWASHPHYEAMIFIAWNDQANNAQTKNDQPNHYSCAWLDVYGSFSPASIGVAPPSENELAFIFKNEKGEPDFSNDFVYDAKTDTWSDALDNIVNGTKKEFGRVKLTRR